MNDGPFPARASSMNWPVTAHAAMTSLPSICTLGMPKPSARRYSGTGDCTLTGTEMAQ